MSVTPLVGRPLEHHEREFVRRVFAHLRDLPKATRVDIERSIIDHLLDRPVTADEETLWSQLGVPHVYARVVREEHGLGAERTDAYARWIAIDRSRRWIGVVVVASVVVSIVTGGLTLRWWLRWEAELSSPLFGICLDYQAGRGCTEIERREAAGRTEAIVDYAPDGGFDIALQPTNNSGRTVRILSVDAPTPRYSLYRFDSVLLDSPATREQEALPFAHYDLQPHADGTYRWVVRFRFDDCRQFGGSAGSTMNFDELLIRYEAFDRTRTTTLPLPSRVSVRMTTDCIAR